ncbi:phage tail tape measure C-terminal domain-containing protein [Tropicimonas sp. S265A]|uniref:phage tail tape measure C-terminal domain-containing protein n=1 Tax=Tropicimonas sp. S265A TaxID=3415134 RepID=UPI003C7CDCA4
MSDMSARFIVTADASQVVTAGRQTQGAMDTLKRETQELNRETTRTGAATAQMAANMREAERSAVANALSLDGVGKNANAASSKLGGFQGSLRNVGLQMNQVAQQGAITGDFLTALAFQLPDILLGFGTAGVLAGTVAGFLTPLVTSMFEAEEGAEAFEKASDRLQGALDRYRESSDLSRMSTEELTDQFGSASVGLAATLALLREIESSEAQRALDEVATSVSDLLGVRGAGDRRSGVADFFDLNIMFAFTDSQREARKEARALTAEFVNQQTILQNSAGSVEEQVTALQKLVEVTTTLVDLDGERSAEEEELLRFMAETLLSAQELSGIDTAQPLADAADQAERLADEIGRAVDAADRLAAKSLSGLAESQIRLDNFGDPVATAVALAGAEFDAAAGPAQGVDPILQRTLDRQRATVVNSARTQAENEQQLAELRRQNRSRRGSGRGQTDLDRTVSGIERDLTRLAPSYEASIEAANSWRARTLDVLSASGEAYEKWADDVELIYGERLIEAYEADLDRRDDWQAGIERGLRDVEDEMANFAATTEDLLVGGLERGEEAWLDWTLTGKASLGDLADFALEQFARMAYQQSIQPALTAGFDLLATGAESLLGIRSHSGSTVGHSSVMSSQRMGAGDQLAVVQRGQTIFTPRQLDNADAILSRLASMAAQPAQVAQGAPNVTVNNYSSSRVEARPDGQGGVQIDVMDQMERDMAGRMRRPNSPMNRALQDLGVRPPYGGGRS